MKRGMKPSGPAGGRWAGGMSLLGASLGINGASVEGMGWKASGEAAANWRQSIKILIYLHGVFINMN